MKLKVKNLLIISWILMLATTFTFKVRTHGESLGATMDGTNILRGGFTIISILILLFILKRLNNSIKIPGIIIPWYIYILFSMMSSFWSYSFMVTFVKTLEILTSLLILLLTYNIESMLIDKMFNICKNIMRILVNFGVIGYILGIEGFYQNSMYSHGFLRGQILSPLLTYGGHSLYSAFLALIYLNSYHKNKDKQSLFRFMYYVIVCLIAFGRSPVIGLVLGIVLFMLVYQFEEKSKASKLIMYGLTMVSLFLIIYIIKDDIMSVFARGQNTEELKNLSGRIPMWNIALNMIRENFLVGVGFGVGSRVAFSKYGTAHSQTVSSVHNGILEVFGGVGIIGLILWIGSLIIPILIAYKKRKNTNSRLLLLTTPLLILTTIMNNILGGWLSLVMAMYFTIIFKIIIEDRKGNEQ